MTNEISETPDKNGESRIADTVDMSDALRAIQEIMECAKAMICVRGLQEEFRPRAVRGKQISKHEAFLHETAVSYIEKYDKRFATLGAFTHFLVETIRTSVHTDKQEQHSQVCLTILAKFAGRSIAHQSPEYPSAEEIERTAIISSSIKLIKKTIDYLMTTELDPDTTKPSS